MFTLKFFKGSDFTAFEALSYGVVKGHESCEKKVHFVDPERNTRIEVIDTMFIAENSIGKTIDKVMGAPTAKGVRNGSVKGRP